jgi:23S rRNA pseudouridine2605 synthase
MEMRLQKILAQAGLGSRRTCEAYIAAGRVKVNGEVASLGMKADISSDQILFDGKPLQLQEEKIYLILNKPPGVLSSLASQGGLPTVDSLVPVKERVFPVGRLDLESEGLILLTNDGELANLLTHPRYKHEKEYRVRLDRPPSVADLERWRRGLKLRDGFQTSPARVWIESQDQDGTWIRVVLQEGHKRQLRESAAVLRYSIRRLIRVRLGSLELGDLAPGAWRMLNPSEVQQLRTSALSIE